MPRIVSTGWAMAPWPLLDQLAQPGGKQRLAVYLWLHRYGHGRQDGCWASVQTLATKCGMDAKNVKVALRWLLDAGWIERLSRPGQTSAYYVRADAPQQTSATWGPKPTQGAKGTQGSNPPQVANPPHDLKESSSCSLSRELKETVRSTVAGKTAHDPTPQDRPPLANVVDASKGESSQRRSTTDRRDSIPSEFHAHTDDLTYWLERRKLKNPRAAKLAVWGPRTRSAGALRKAIAAGVVKPYLEQAAEAGWASLGFAGYEEVIAKLSGKGSSFGGRPEPAALRPYVMSS